MQCVELNIVISHGADLGHVQECPVVLRGDRFVLDGVLAATVAVSSIHVPPMNQMSVQEISASPPVVPAPAGPSDIEDEAMTEISHDDPVGDAFRQALNHSDPGEFEDEEDEIVWDPR